ncbi:MAG: AI-2E family transporter [Cytobacillus gottheilii]|uniref:AI-2E family transporter n=1 Tax=Cytobacillus gottheilii TaxID=859144 RepID=UPI003463D859
MPKKKFQFWALQFLIVLTIIYVSTKISFLFQPVGIFVSTLFFPIIISGFLFFMLNPLVQRLHKWKVPKVVAILLIYAAVIGVVVLAVGNLVPMISNQIAALVNDMPTYVEKTEEFFDSLSETQEFQWITTQQYITQEEIIRRITEYANTLPDRITSGISGIFSVVTNIAITIVTVPFLLFYMMKDGDKFPAAIAKFFPAGYREEGIKTLKETANTLSSYIQGQITVALFVGTLSLIGYWIIDLPYMLVMALIVAVTNIIPYVGPFLGGAPAVIVALFDSPGKAILVVIVILVAQQIEGNVLSPLILGKSLNTHPATIIILLLVAGNLAGILGMILAVPTYAVAKTIFVNTVKFFRTRKLAQSEIPPI